jgi:hypothetical protein
MKIAFSSAPFGKVGSDDFKQVGELIAQPNGYSILKWGPTTGNGQSPINPGTILGINPEGVYSAGDASLIGNGQQFKLVSGSLVIRPNININDGSILIPGAPTVAYVIAAREL